MLCRKGLEERKIQEFTTMKNMIWVCLFWTSPFPKFPPGDKKQVLWKMHEEGAKLAYIYGSRLPKIMGSRYRDFLDEDILYHIYPFSSSFFPKILCL